MHSAGHYLAHHFESTKLLKELRYTTQNSACGFKVKISKSYLLQYLPPRHQTPLFDLGLAHFFILVYGFLLISTTACQLSVNAASSFLIKSECLFKDIGQNRNCGLKCSDSTVYKIKQC